MKFTRQARFLKSAREKAGYTQCSLSKKLGLSCSQFISNIERARSGIPPRKVRKIAKILRREPRDFMAPMVLDYKETLRSALYE